MLFRSKVEVGLNLLLFLLLLILQKHLFFTFMKMVEEQMFPYSGIKEMVGK